MSAQAPMMTLGQALAWVPGARLVGDAETPVVRVHTDTRSLQPGDLFVALRGERFDANDFLADARAIAETLAQAAPADVVLIAGKGHEAWQEADGVRTEFSDRIHALDALQRRSPE